MKFAIVCVICLINNIVWLSAQERWTLEQCIQYAYDNNIQLKQQELNVEVDRNNLLQSKLGILPNLNASANYNSSKGKTLDNTTFTIIEGTTVNSVSGNVGGSMTIFKGLQQKNTIQQNEFMLKANIENVEKLKNDLSINIVLYYLQIIHAQEQLSVAMSQLELTRSQVQRTTNLVDVGKLSEVDLFDIESQAAHEELQVVNAQNVLNLAKLDLVHLLDLKSADDFQVAIPDFSDIGVKELGWAADHIFLVAESNLPQVKAAEYQLKVAEKSLSVARGNYSPSLTLSGGYNTRYSSSASMAIQDINGNVVYTDYPFWDQLKDGINSYVGIGLNIPIFNGWQAKTGVKNAKLRLLNYQYQLQLIKNTLQKEIQQAYADAVASFRKYEASAKTVISTKEAFRATEQRYEVGIMNFVDYSTAKTRLTAAQSEMLQAKFEYIFKLKILNFYNGHQITL